MPKSNNNTNLQYKKANKNQNRNQNLTKNNNNNKKQINKLKLTSVKHQIKQYLDTTKSNDNNEKMAKCKQIIKIYKLNKQQKILTNNWMISIWFPGEENKNKNKNKNNKNKWKKVKEKTKRKKSIIKQNSALKAQKSKEIGKEQSKKKINKIDNNHNSQIDINMNVSKQINNVIMETDKITQSKHITTYTSPTNDITILYDTITYVNSEYIFANWSDMIIEYETPKTDNKPNTQIEQKEEKENKSENNNINNTSHQNKQITYFYNYENTSKNYAIINQIEINKNNNNNIMLNVWQLKTTTIKDQNNAYTQVSINNAIQKEWEFHYTLKNHWYQQHLAQRNLFISYKILTNYNTTNETTLNWAFRTHNLPFKPNTPKSKSKQTQHQWQKKFIQHILTQTEWTIKHNIWLSTIIYYHTMEDIHKISKWNSSILIKQLKIKPPLKQNKPKYRKAILLLIKQHFNINKLNFETTLEKIYEAQNTSSTTKIKQNQQQFKMVFNTIREHIKYKIPNENKNTTIQAKLGFNPDNMPQRQLLNESDKQLISKIIPQLPKLQPTNLALGYIPSKTEEEICTLGPKFVPQPTTKNINFFEIHNGMTRTFNQIKFRMLQCLDYILNLNAIPKDIFTQKMPVISKKHKKHDRIYKSLQPLKNSTI